MSSNKSVGILYYYCSTSVSYSVYKSAPSLHHSLTFKHIRSIHRSARSLPGKADCGAAPSTDWQQTASNGSKHFTAAARQFKPSSPTLSPCCSSTPSCSSTLEKLQLEASDYRSACGARERARVRQAHTKAEGIYESRHGQETSQLLPAAGKGMMSNICRTRKMLMGCAAR